MRPLSASDAIRIWEWGQGQHPVERAIALLTVACPEMTPHQLAALSIGERDARLLTLRELIFGSKLSSATECPCCRERLEFTFNVADIRTPSAAETAAEYTCRVGEFECRFRLPNSSDLAIAARCKNVEASRQALVVRCILHARFGEETIPCSDLPPEAIAQLAEQMGDCDPQAEVLLDFNCPTCGCHWQSVFDIANFLWQELAARAKQLLRQVHTLARAYGWREADILAMSAKRRQFYLEMVTQ